MAENIPETPEERATRIALNAPKIPLGILGTAVNFSALTASIIMEDIGVIGELQSISVEETYDVRPLSEIGSNVVNAFIPGVYRGILRAQRGVVDLDLVFQKLLPASDTNTMKDKLTAIAPNEAAFFSLNNVVQNIFDSTTSNNRLSYNITFRIEIQDAGGNTFMKLENCMLNTRRISMNPNQVLILQDIEIVYRKRSI